MNHLIWLIPIICAFAIWILWPVFATDPPKEFCRWANNPSFDRDVWETSCWEAWVFTEGGPADNRIKFCPYCGREIKVEEP